jgi:hypothetical protein
MMLNLTESLHRDRFVLRSGMRIVLKHNNKLFQFTLESHLAPIPSSNFASATGKKARKRSVQFHTEVEACSLKGERSRAPLPSLEEDATEEPPRAPVVWVLRASSGQVVELTPGSSPLFLNRDIVLPFPEVHFLILFIEFTSALSKYYRIFF